MQRHRSLSATLALLAGLARCGPMAIAPTDAAPASDTARTDAVAPDARDPLSCSSLRITNRVHLLNPGGTEQFTATLTDTDDTMRDVTALAQWSSSNPSAATISPTGLATAVTFGTATIIATFGVCRSNPVTLSVVGSGGFSLSISPVFLSIAVGSEPQQLYARGHTPEGQTLDVNGEMGLVWMSSNPMVARVDARGRVTAVAPGRAFINASIGGVLSSPTEVTVRAAGG